MQGYPNGPMPMSAMPVRPQPGMAPGAMPGFGPVSLGGGQYAAPRYAPPGPPATYPTQAPQGLPVQPQLYQTPGPAPLNQQQYGSPGPAPGGVAGVAMAPMSPVAAPAVQGGPHALPPLPQFPLPQGFPNPFAVQEVNPAQPKAVPVGPGSTVTTGPAGHLPGIGTFGMDGGPGQPTVPGPLQGAAPGSAPAMPPLPLPQQTAPAMPAPAPAERPVWPEPFPSVPPQAYAPPLSAPAYAPPVPPPQQTQVPVPAAGAAPPPPAPPGPAAAAPQRQATGGGEVHPFWLQLAWQLIQAPAVRAALGDRYDSLAEGESRIGTLQLAAGCLAGPELQASFQRLTGGGLTQTQFIDQFAVGFREALQKALLL